MLSIEEQLKAARTTALFFLTELCVVRIAGPDAVRYLHGRVTQDVKGLKPGDSARSLLLTPQGRVQGHFRILRRSEDLLLISDPLSEAERLEFIQSLLQFKVADQLTADITDHRALLICGTEAGDKIATFDSSHPPELNRFHSLNKEGTELIIAAVQLGTSIPAYLVITEERNLVQLSSELESSLHLTRGDHAGLEALRIQAGIPRWGLDLTDKVLGPEVPVEELVSFNKGCYAGQEVVEMATARGRPNRQLVKFSVPGREVTAGSKLSTDNSKAAAGEVTSSVYLPQDNRSLILALVKTSELEKPLFSEGTKLSAL